jgi:hypothetical protein
VGLKLGLWVCEYPTYARGFVVVSGKVRETTAEEACDKDGCCIRVLLEPETNEVSVASYTVVATTKGIYIVVTFYSYNPNKRKWVKVKVHEEAVDIE